MVVVITGASSGLGKDAACAFAERGASLILAAPRGELLAELAEHCIALGGRALPVTTDVGRPEDVERLAQIAWREFGRIDVWIDVSSELGGRQIDRDDAVQALLRFAYGPKGRAIVGTEVSAGRR